MIFSRLRNLIHSGNQIFATGRETRLQDSIEILLGKGKLLFCNFRSFHSIQIGSIEGLLVSLRHLVVSGTAQNQTFWHQFDLAISKSCKISTRRMLKSNPMADSASITVLDDAFENLSSRLGHLTFSSNCGRICFGNHISHSCRKASLRLENQQKFMFSPICRYLNGTSVWNSSLSCSGVGSRYFCSTVSCLSGNTAGAIFENSKETECLKSSRHSSNGKMADGKTLKLLSASCYFPHPDKEKTGGEDAHFICIDEHAIGVADGVGGWAEVGIDAGKYSRELMSNSVIAIREEPKGSIDPSRVLEKAHSNTKAEGSSTACIIALTDNGFLHAINLGDSGFIVIRNGSTIFQSPVQQHEFNFTYQLGNGIESDLPSSGEVFTVDASPRDVIVTGTDGLFDNLYNNEITALVIHSQRAGLGPQATAQKIAALARQRAQEHDRQTPFSSAAQDAGVRYYGGKLDDITVVVSYITSCSEP